MIRVFIVDDHKSVVDSFSNVIKNEEDMVLVGSASGVKEALELCKELKPDVVLTDISMENSDSGIILTKTLKESFSDIKVIVMSGFDEISYIPKAKNVKADAFVSKSNAMDFFLKMIRAVINNEGSFPENIKIPTAVGESPFTDRELEILRLICHSYSRKEIANKLKVAEGTIKRHIENMLLKSNCKSTMELAVYVVGNGWISAK